MRAKAAKSEKRKSEKRSKGFAARGGGGVGSRAEKVGLGREGTREEVREKEGIEMSRVEEMGLGVVGLGKPWSVQAGIQSHARDRSVAPPALPVPIASFII
jgi:hypothetical protein